MGLFAAKQLVYRPGRFGVAQPLAVWLWRWRGKLVFLSRRQKHSGMSTECERTVSGVFLVFVYKTRAAWQYKTVLPATWGNSSPMLSAELWIVFERSSHCLQRTCRRSL
jgi:hypothetical protein